MPTDVKAIQDLSQTIAELSKQFEGSETPSKDVQSALVLAAEKLAIATREPDENMYSIAGQVLIQKLNVEIPASLLASDRSLTMQLFAVSSLWEYLTQCLKTEARSLLRTSHRVLAPTLYFLV